MEYILIPNKDSHGNDVTKVDFNFQDNSFPARLRSEQLPAQLQHLPAFNTNGYFKSKIQRLNDVVIDSSNIGGGLYVKNVLSEFPVLVVNLNRRQDRWNSISEHLKSKNITNFEKFEAVDGRELTLTNELKYLFRGNDFNFRRGVIGCALSHIKIWRRLINDPKNNYYIVLEDDAELVDNFDSKLNLMLQYIKQHSCPDVVMLGHFFMNGKPERSNEHPSGFELFDFNNFRGGTYGYIVSKAAAWKYTQIVNTDGVQNGIDWFMKLNHQKVNIFITVPHLIHSEYFNYNGVDTDIQNDYTPISENVNDIPKNNSPMDGNFNDNNSHIIEEVMIKFIGTQYTTEEINVLLKNEKISAFLKEENIKTVKFVFTNDVKYFLIINHPEGSLEYYDPKKTILIHSKEPEDSWGKWRYVKTDKFYKFISLIDIKNFVTPYMVGGLGNQLFMIANAYCIAKDNDLKFILNDTYNSNRKTYFDTLFKNLSVENINLSQLTSVKEKEFSYNEIAVPKNSNILLHGYFQSDKYFNKYKNEIYELFSLPQDIKDYATEKLNSYNDKIKVAVHIRRGDYVGSDLHYVQPIQFYLDSQKYMNEKLGEDKISYIYISEDIEWVKSNFNIREVDVVVEEKHDYHEFAMMQLCDHFVICNSTFSWWAAWLSKNSDKIVIIPKVWFCENKMNAKDLYVNDWIVI